MIPCLLAPYAGRAYALLRIVCGLLFAVHGAQKLFGMFGGGFQPAAGSQLWFGAVIELGAGLLIAVGLFTSWASFLSSGTMAVAYLQFHWKFEGAAALLPWVNKGELALVYAFVFLYMACRGDGAWSLGGRRAAA
jgi:putative oxidoreductase